MSNYDAINDQANDDDGNNQAQESPSTRRLREAAERGEQAARERDDALRKLAFLEAGVNLKSDVGQLLFEAYKGELDENAIREAAQKVGALVETASANQSTTPVPPEEQGQTRERDDLAGDSRPAGVDPGVDPQQQGLNEFHEALSQGQDREKAGKHYFDRVFTAAANNDERALVPKKQE